MTRSSSDPVSRLKRRLRLMRWRAQDRLDDELLLAEAMLGKRSIFVDIGVHMGVYSFTLADTVRASIGFEPMPASLETLRRDAPDNCLFFPYAISDRSGTAALSFPQVSGRKRTGWASLERQSFGDIKEFSGQDVATEAVQVDLRRLDDVIDEALAAVPGEAPDRLDLLKIDVEGHEAAVLAGASETIDRFRPVLIIEAEERHAPGSTAKVFEFMAEKGYRGYAFVGRSLRPVPDATQISDRAVNFVFMP